MTLTFDWFVKDCTPAEHDELAWHLAMFRARKTWEALRWKGNTVSPTAAMTDATADSKTRRSRKKTVTGGPTP
jgi:hypothetical protein